MCGINEVNVDAEAGTYNYTNIDYCDHLDHNISVHIAGRLSSDPNSPGLLHENAEIFNHTMGQLDPNMIFRVNRDSAGNIVELFTYACLGKLPPVVGKELFSFNLLSRSNWYADEKLKALVAEANASSSGHLDLEGLRFNNMTTYRDCHML